MHCFPIYSQSTYRCQAFSQKSGKKGVRPQSDDRAMHLEARKGLSTGQNQAARFGRALGDAKSAAFG